MFAHSALGHRRSSLAGLIVAAGLAALLAAAPALAATWTWTGNAGNNSWNNSGNWSPISPPANDGTADIIFGATPRLTPDLTLPWNVKSLTFNNTAGAYNLFSTLGNTLTVGARDHRQRRGLPDHQPRADPQRAANMDRPHGLVGD